MIKITQQSVPITKAVAALSTLSGCSIQKYRLRSIQK
jgi:hypothetical protein